MFLPFPSEEVVFHFLPFGLGLFVFKQEHRPSVLCLEEMEHLERWQQGSLAGPRQSHSCGDLGFGTAAPDWSVKRFFHGKPGLHCTSVCPMQQPLNSSRRSGIVSRRASVCVCACVRAHTCVLGGYIALFVCLSLEILIPRGQWGK